MQSHIGGRLKGVRHLCFLLSHQKNKRWNSPINGANQEATVSIPEPNDAHEARSAEISRDSHGNEALIVFLAPIATATAGL